MKVNPVNVKINDLIDEHNEVSPYGDCPGCDLCLRIERISKEQGMWMEGGQKRKETAVKTRKIKKEEVKRLLDDGYTLRGIARKYKVNEQLIGNRVKKWFPEYQRFKELTLSLEEYESLLEKGIKKRQIAERFNTDYNVLTYHIKKLRRAKKADGNIKGNAMC